MVTMTTPMMRKYQKISKASADNTDIYMHSVYVHLQAIITDLEQLQWHENIMKE